MWAMGVLQIFARQFMNMEETLNWEGKNCLKYWVYCLFGVLFFCFVFFSWRVGTWFGLLIFPCSFSGESFVILTGMMSFFSGWLVILPWPVRSWIKNNKTKETDESNKEIILYSQVAQSWVTWVSFVQGDETLPEILLASALLVFF